MQVLDQAVAATGLSPQQIAKYGCGVGVVLCMLGLGQIYITCMLGVIYPVIMSFIALESKGAADDKQWLTYWVVFGLFNIVDQFASFILHYIPFYHFLKLCFLVFLYLPQVKGATMVYDALILPNFASIDSKVGNMESALHNTSTSAVNASKDKLNDAANAVKGKAADAVNAGKAKIGMN